MPRIDDHQVKLPYGVFLPEKATQEASNTKIPSPPIEHEKKNLSLKDRIIKTWTLFKRSACVQKIIAIWRKIFCCDKKILSSQTSKEPPPVVKEIREEPLHEVPQEKKQIQIQPIDLNKKNSLPPEINIDQALPNKVQKNLNPLAYQEILEKFVFNLPEDKPIYLKQPILQTPIKTEDPQIGQKISREEAIAQMDLYDKNFTENDKVIIQRMGPPSYFQYGRIIKALNNGLYELDVKDDTGYIKKSPEAIFKIGSIKKKPTEPLIQHTPEENDLLVKEGPRTLGMFNFLKKLTAYKPTNNVIRLNGKDYIPLTGNTRDISTKPIASCGSSKEREIIVLDPNNSPKLNNHYHTIEQKLQKIQKEKGSPLTEEEVLKHIQDYVRHHIFTSRYDPDLEQKVNVYVRKRQDMPTTPKAEIKDGSDKAFVPIIPIDDFIDLNLGVCRHHALVTAYILDRLTKEPSESRMLDGMVQHMRENVPSGLGEMGGHIWVTFIGKTRWHIDTLWKEVTNFSTSEGIKYLKLRGYGEEAINNQVRKVDRLESQEARKKHNKKINTEQKIEKEGIVPYLSIVAQAFLTEKGRIKGRYILSQSQVRDFQYSLSFLDERGEYKKIRMKVDNEGRIQTEHKETFDSFEDCKKQLKLTSAYGMNEMLARSSIEKEISKDFKTYEGAQNYLVENKNAGDFILRHSSHEDYYSLHFLKKNGRDNQHDCLRFTINPEGKIELNLEDNNKTIYNNFEELKNRLGLKS